MDVYFTNSGLPQGQEKLMKMTKVRKKWGILKKLGQVRIFDKI